MQASDWKAGDTDWRNKGVFKKFWQTEFLDTYTWQWSGLADYGYVYYPDNCYKGNKQCKVHMHLHGCGQTVDGLFFGVEDLTHGGWLEYAAANDIILLLPQAKFNLLGNPFECFDYYGYVQWWDRDNLTYVTKKGAQMQALKGMLDRTLSPLDEDYVYGSKNIGLYNDFEYWMFDTWRWMRIWPELLNLGWFGFWVYILPSLFA